MRGHRCAVWTEGRGAPRRGGARVPAPARPNVRQLQPRLVSRVFLLLPLRRQQGLGSEQAGR
eukprot:5364583-Lingulodinium_polyedra.AAC.1